MHVEDNGGASDASMRQPSSITTSPAVRGMRSKLMRVRANHPQVDMRVLAALLAAYQRVGHRDAQLCYKVVQTLYQQQAKVSTQVIMQVVHALWDLQMLDPPTAQRLRHIVAGRRTLMSAQQLASMACTLANVHSPGGAVSRPHGDIMRALTHELALTLRSLEAAAAAAAPAAESAAPAGAAAPAAESAVAAGAADAGATPAVTKGVARRAGGRATPPTLLAVLQEQQGAAARGPPAAVAALLADAAGALYGHLTMHPADWDREWLQLGRRLNMALKQQRRRQHQQPPVPEGDALLRLVEVAWLQNPGFMPSYETLPLAERTARAVQEAQALVRRLAEQLQQRLPLVPEARRQDVQRHLQYLRRLHDPQGAEAAAAAAAAGTGTPAAPPT